MTYHELMHSSVPSGWIPFCWTVARLLKGGPHWTISVVAEVLCSQWSVRLGARIVRNGFRVGMLGYFPEGGFGIKPGVLIVRKKHGEPTYLYPMLHLSIFWKLQTSTRYTITKMQNGKRRKNILLLDEAQFNFPSVSIFQKTRRCSDFPFISHLNDVQAGFS